MDDQYLEINYCPWCDKYSGLIVVDGDFGHGRELAVISKELAVSIVLTGVKSKKKVCNGCCYVLNEVSGGIDYGLSQYMS